MYKRIIATGFISSNVDLKSISDNAIDFNSLSMEEKKRFLMEIIDKNLLYVNYCDIDDEDFAINQDDKDFSDSFYENI